MLCIIFSHWFSHRVHPDRVIAFIASQSKMRESAQIQSWPRMYAGWPSIAVEACKMRPGIEYWQVRNLSRQLPHCCKGVDNTIKCGALQIRALLLWRIVECTNATAGGGQNQTTRTNGHSGVDVAGYASSAAPTAAAASVQSSGNTTGPSKDLLADLYASCCCSNTVSNDVIQCVSKVPICANTPGRQVVTCRPINAEMIEINLEAHDTCGNCVIGRNPTWLWRDSLAPL